MMKKLRHWLLLLIIMGIVGVGRVAAATAGELNFIWGGGGGEEPAYFNLVVDGVVLVSEIKNEMVNGENYALAISRRGENANYQLVVHTELAAGDHLWQVLGYNSAGEQMMASNLQEMTIQNQYSLGDVLVGLAMFVLGSQAVVRTIGMIFTITLTIGFTLCLVFYGLVFISNLIAVGNLKRVLGALGFKTKKSEDGGMVFDIQNYRGVPFAIITVEGVNPEQEKIVETLVTDVDGIYSTASLPTGYYKLKVERTGYSFPVLETRPPYMSRYDFYKGEPFTIKSKFDQVSMNIPMTPEMTVVGDRQKRSWRNTWTLLVKAVWKGLRRLNYALLVMAVVGFCLQPGMIYGVGVVFYGILTVNAWVKVHQRRTLRGVVVDEKGRGLTNAIVNLNHLDSKRLVAVTPVDETGRFFFTVPAGKYQLTIRKEGYVCMENGKPNVSGELVEAGKGELKVLQMQPYEVTTDEWLWKEEEAD